MIAFLFATEQEARPFLKSYERGRFDGLPEGEVVSDDHILVAITGVGKIKAALRTERLLRSEKVKRIVHPGTCTSLNDTLALGTLVGASQVFEGDRIELSAPTYPRMPLEMPFKIGKGTLVTQDHTPQAESEQSYWQRIADMSDMTGYAVAFVAATYGVQCNIIKAVTGYMYEEDSKLQQTLETAHGALTDFLIGELPNLIGDDK
ncbi:MAG: 5'-methylthioadenosine nucleosidase [Rhodothermales bacterium]